MPTTFVQERLDNGLRIVIEVMPNVQSAACGFLSRTGSRDETPDLAGVSHFLEHMCFKGTPHRTWREISVEFDEMGSTYNAFTTKDRTFYFGWVRARDVERQMALIADMMRSSLPPDEFATEKKVVLDEIARSRDQLEDLAYHLLHEKTYEGSSMAWPVLGYEAALLNLERHQMDEYFRRRYAPDNLLLVVSGNVSPESIIAAARRLTADWPPGVGPIPPRTPPVPRAGTAVHPVERFNQQAILIAFPAAAATDDACEDAAAAAAILGGENSRFYWNIVQAGIAPRASVMYEDYQDCGLMVLYGFGEPDHAERLSEAMQKEAECLIREGVEPREVERVRNKRRTAFAAEAEAPYHRLLQIMDDVDYRGRPRTVEERLERVSRVTPESIAAYLKRFPITGDGQFVSVGPRRWPPI